MQCTCCQPPTMRRCILTRSLTRHPPHRCGHNYCQGCIEEWIARAHSCPLCKEGLVVGDLIKNHTMDSLLGRIAESKKRAEERHFSEILRTSSTSSGGGGGGTDSNDNGDAEEGKAHHTAIALNPIQAVFRKHLKNVLYDVESYYAELQGRLRAGVEKLRLTLAAQVDRARLQHHAQVKSFDGDAGDGARGAGGEGKGNDGGGDGGRDGGGDNDGGVPPPPGRSTPSAVDAMDTTPVDGPPPGPPSLDRQSSRTAALQSVQGAQAAHQAKVEELHARFDSAVALLVKSYDEYMAGMTPPVNLLPTTVTVRVASKNVRREEMKEMGGGCVHARTWARRWVLSDAVVCVCVCVCV